MPTGLPDLSEFLLRLRSHAHFSIEYLEIPSYGLVKDHFQIALQDVTKATRSTTTFLQITSRPLLILLSIVTRYLFILLKILAKHTIYHVILAAKEAWRQIVFVSRWFVAFQKSLPKTAIYMELGFIVLLIGLYSIRRYIKRKKYVERFMKWYRGKRSAAIMKYNRIVDRVAQTSIVLALLLPHILYVVAIGSIKWFIPTFLRYFACKTLLSDLISLYVPFIKTILVLHKWKSFGFAVDGKGGKRTGQKNKEDVDNQDKDETKFYGGGLVRMFRKRHVGSAYKATIENKDKRRQITTRTRLSEEEKKVVAEASKLLQYWIVYILICSAAQIAMLLPIIGRVLSNSTKVSTLPWKQKKLTWMNHLKPNPEFFQEFKLAFIVWLRMLPASVFIWNTSHDSEGSIVSSTSKSVKNHIAAYEKSTKKTRKLTKVPFSNCPIDIIYEHCSPLAIALLSSSSRLLQKDDGNDAGSGARSLFARAVTWCRSFLDVMVWTKMITENTKLKIIAILVECSDLLPATVTLFMPAYFTNYGIISISLLVPSGASANTLNALKDTTSNTETVKTMSSVLRYLQYWVIHIIMSSILSAFSPILAWVPLSTHMTFILWAYVQLEGTTVALYNALEWDLVVFGLLDAQPRHEATENMDVKDSTTMKVFNSIVKRVPSGLHNQESIARQDGENAVQSVEIRSTKNVNKQEVTPKDNQVEMKSSKENGEKNVLENDEQEDQCCEDEKEVSETVSSERQMK